MAKGRPAKEDSQYTMHVHKNGGHMYASTNIYTVGEDGKRRYRYTHWGSLDEDKRFTPEINFYHAPVEERRKLIFLADWDLTAIGKKSQSPDKRGVVRYEAEDVDRHYGPTWLLDKVDETIRSSQAMLDKSAFDKAHHLMTIEYDGDKVKSYADNPDAIVIQQ